jgi:hypothetical protein
MSHMQIFYIPNDFESDCRKGKKIRLFLLLLLLPCFLLPLVSKNSTELELYLGVQKFTLGIYACQDRSGLSEPEGPGGHDLD